MPPPERPELIIWRFIDGKPGHEKQTLGLCQALGRQARIRTFSLRASELGVCLRSALFKRFPAGRELPDPDLLIGAGHGTHAALLAARRARGGKAVILMKPSLPTRLFDLCLIPEHDQPPARGNIIPTHGALNAVVRSSRHQDGLGVFLIGGPSSHYKWDSQHVAGQIQDIARTFPQTQWWLTTSRRTPEEFLNGLFHRPENIEIFPHTETPPGWLEAALAQAGQAWVTEDSVSMLYEALTAGCTVGLLQLPGGTDGRVARGIAALVDRGWVTPYREWREDRRLAPAPENFDEAARCARLILEKWFPSSLI